MDLENRVIDINHSMTYFRRGKRPPYTFEFKATQDKSRRTKDSHADDVYEVQRNCMTNSRSMEALSG